MPLFWMLLVKLIPLYLLMALGFFAGRKLHAQSHTVASLLLYIITPAIIFQAALTAPLTTGTLLLPGIVFLLCTSIGLLFLLSRKAYLERPL